MICTFLALHEGSVLSFKARQRSVVRWWLTAGAADTDGRIPGLWEVVGLSHLGVSLRKQRGELHKLS